MEALLNIGLLIFLIGAIGTVIVAFKNRILWGIGCLLFFPISLIFIVLHWSDAKNPFFLQLIGIVIMAFSRL